MMTAAAVGAGDLSSAAAQSTDALQWRAAEKRVDARIQDWPLQKLLEEIAGATGWEVLVDPAANSTVSVSFKDLSVREALRRLLSSVNYAVLPQASGPPRLYVYQHSMQEATRFIRPVRRRAGGASGRPIANELVVVLKPGGGSIEDLAKRLGAKVTGRIDGSAAYRLEFGDEDLARAARELLGSDEDVSSIENNYPVEQPTRMSGLDLSSSALPAIKAKPATGGQVIVGLVDTGVQADSALSAFLLPAIQIAGSSGTGGNGITHGTSMAETVLQGMAVATQGQDGTSARILPVDVYGDRGSTSTFDVAKGILAAVNAGANPVNLSLGSEGDSPLMRNIIANAHLQGVVFVAAAGNEPTTAPTYPAAYPEVLAVTAGDRRGNVASYANRGDFVDVVAPGTSVVHFGSEAFAVSGTSASTAYVSGMAAAMASDGKMTVGEAEAKLRAALSVPKTEASPGTPTKP